MQDCQWIRALNFYLAPNFVPHSLSPSMDLEQVLATCLHRALLATDTMDIAADLAG
jgi:hypothetical protein